ncbi:MAG: EAL domain-containing protein [Thermoleophilaceae bacterium]|nr:EAL domain-containing protein [Thermoleophilaceae bacterium]
MRPRDLLHCERRDPVAPAADVSPAQQIERLEQRLVRERRARHEAEEIAERTVSTLYDRQRELELLEAIAEASNNASTLDQALSVAIDKICDHTGWPVGHAYLVTPPDGRLVSSRIWHLDDPVRFDCFRRVSEEKTFIAGEGLPGRVVATGEPVWIQDAMQDDNFPRRHAAPDAGVHAAFGFPILVGAEAVGVIEIFSHQATEIDRGLLAVAAQIGTQLGRVVERARGEEHAHRAVHDSLTGLPNRALFLDRLRLALARRLRTPALTGILFIDLDRFKVVNDTYGHRAGDELLVEVARRLDAVVRAGDTVARFHGDEFVVLCEGLSEREVLRLAERVQLSLLAPFGPPSDTARLVTASIGITLARTTETNAEGLLRDADAAMYRAKELGGGRYELFDGAMRERLRKRVHTERMLGRALRADELCLHYQPILSLSSRQIEGVEALLRWEDPERGLVPPDDFLPVAEESGLILLIGAWVLREACRQAADWRRELGDRAPLPVCVNLAARQLGQDELPEIVSRTLSDTGLDPRDLMLEITESALIENTTVPARTLADLRAGVRVLLDDFGTGYASLSYLRRFKIDMLKIDRSFVAELGERSEASPIVAAIVGMGHALGLKIVAEGIETEEQAAEAARLGCDSAQGYLFATPAAADRVRAMTVSDDPSVVLAPRARPAAAGG